jgi:4-aminobutyrate aminotransferase-like enzyme
MRDRRFGALRCPAALIFRSSDEIRAMRLPPPPPHGEGGAVLPEIVTQIPGPRSRELAARLRRSESRHVTYVDAEFPVFWERAEGVNVWDVDANRFLDLTSAFAVAGLGHAPPAILEAMQQQAESLLHAMGDVHPTEAKVRLCEELARITFGRWTGEPAKVMLGSAGFEAVESALKTAFLHTGKRGVLAFRGGYHGLGYGALETCGWSYFREPFRRQLADFATLLPYPNCFRCPFGNMDAARLGDDAPACSVACLAKLEGQLRAAFATAEIGCVLVEPAQGRGGEIFPPREFLPMLRRLCDEFAAVLVFDEIYTGFNRTGRLFACEETAAVPDLICLGKALTGGFPLSACVGRAAIMDAWPESTGEALHTSTFLGHPVGCAMALASIAAHLKPEVANLVREKGARLKAGLRAIDSPLIGEVRGAGLMIGVELVQGIDDPRPDAAATIRVVKGALRGGILLLGGGRDGNVLSFSPPFTIRDDEMNWAVARLAEILKAEPPFDPNST